MLDIARALIIVMNSYHTMEGIQMFWNALPVTYTSLIMAQYDTKPDDRFSDRTLVFLSNQKWIRVS